MPSDTAYLDKAATFSNPPEVGEQWPRDGYYIPSADIFMEEFSRRASIRTMDILLKATKQAEANASPGEATQRVVTK